MPCNLISRTSGSLTVMLVVVSSIILLTVDVSAEDDLEWDPCKINYDKKINWFASHNFSMPPNCVLQNRTVSDECEYFSCRSKLQGTKTKVGYFRVRPNEPRSLLCRRFPQLPAFVHILDFSESLEDDMIVAKDFADLNSLAQVRSLLLIGSLIEGISDEVVRRFSNLECVNIDHSRKMIASFVRSLLSLPSLMRFSAMATVLSSEILPSGTSNLRSFQSASSFKYFGDPKTIVEIVNAFPRLEELKVRSSGLYDPIMMKSDTLEELDFSNNLLERFPGFCHAVDSLDYDYASYKAKQPTFPRLSRIDLSRNQLAYLDKDDGQLAARCLPKLTFLDLRQNLITDIDLGFFALRPSLRFVYLQFQLAEKMELNSYMYDDTSLLTELYLENHNQLRFDVVGSPDVFDKIKYFFLHSPYTQKLYLNGSNLQQVDEDTFVETFGHLAHLQILSLPNTKLEFVSAAAFGNFPYLTVLILRDNAITSIPAGCFDALTQLSHLDLAGNKITTVSEGTFGPSLRGGLTFLDLSRNPLTCSCDLMWFRCWFLAHLKLFGSSASEYKCHNVIPKIYLSNFVVNQQSCLLSREANSLIIFSCSLIIILFTSFTLLFRYRWHLRLVLYEAFRGRGEARRLHLEQGNFEFDLFVSYASEDLNWVRRHLMPHLEDRLHLRLCIHDRQFIPGKNIVDNIVDCVESSKKIMMVFSKRFVRSQWCQFELAYCLTHVMEHEDALLIVCVDDVVSCEMTSAMMAVLKTTTYIQWLAQADAVRSFWGRLDIALKEVMPNDEHAL